MSYGICPLSVVPIRNSSSHKSEMISQLLFGEVVEIIERKGKQWVKVRCQMDNFVGWVATPQIKPITPSEFAAFQQKYAFSLDVMQPIMANSHFIPITLGGRLPNFDGIRFSLGEDTFTFSGQAVFPEDIKPSAEFIIKIAKRFLNAPYLWGGRSPFGIDSDGLVQLVFSIGGILLPREVAQQVHMGHLVDFVEEALPGDLAFFENRNGKITHSGIILPDQRVIHAYGKVRIDRIDHFGIFNEEQAVYTHKLRVAKRILPKQLRPLSNETEIKTVKNQQVELF